jgi:hypothetical protein
VELGVEVERPSIPIPEELVLESEPRLARSVRLVADDVLELNGDGAVEPREDNAVHEAPGARWRSVVVDEDVIVEDETPQREKDLSAPTGVVGRRRIQHHGHEGPDVVQSSGLGVESSDKVGVEVGGEGVRRGFHRGDRRATGEYGGRDGVAPGWGSEGGKPRRGTTAQRQRGSDVEWPEAGDVGGPSMGKRAADFSRGNRGVRRGAGGAHGGQHGRSGGDVVRVHRGDGAAGTVAVGLAAASGR